MNFHKKILRKLSENQIVATAVSIGVGIACGPAAGMCVMVLNAAMTAANGGTLKQVLTGAAVGYVGGRMSAWLGQAIGGGSASAGLAFASNTGAAMLVGGATAKAQGGKFIDGVKGAAAGAAIGGLIRGGIAAYKDYQMRKSVVFGGRVGIDFESPAMDNTLGAVPEPAQMTDGVNTALPAETAANKALPKSVPELELDLSPTTSGEYRAPVKSIHNVSNGLSFTIEEIKFGAAFAADHANKFVPWLYGKGLQIGGHVVKGVGIFTKNLAIENSGDILIDAGRAITPEDHVIIR